MTPSSRPPTVCFHENRAECTQPGCADILNGAFLPPPTKISKHDNYILSPSALPFSQSNRIHLFPCQRLWEKLQGHWTQTQGMRHWEQGWSCWGAQSSILILQWTRAMATRATSKKRRIAAHFCEQLLLKNGEKSHGMNREHPSTSSQQGQATLNPPQLLFHSCCTWHQVMLTVACEELGVFLVDILSPYQSADANTPTLTLLLGVQSSNAWQGTASQWKCCHLDDRVPRASQVTSLLQKLSL